MHTLRTWLFALLGVLAAAAPSFAQAASDVQVGARLSTGVVKLGSNVVLAVQVVGAKDAAIAALPEVAGLRFVPDSSPDVVQSWERSGGRQRTTVMLTWQIEIRPEAKGEYKIPPVTVRAGGREYTTRELSLRVVEDMRGEELGFFEIRHPTSVVEGQPFTLDMRFGWDEAFSASRNYHNLYANLNLPWVDALPGLVELDPPPPNPGATFTEGVMLNSESRLRVENQGSVDINGRKVQMFRWQRRYLPSRSGKLEFSTSHLEFGYVENDVFMVSRNKETFYKRVAGFEVAVEKLPEQGKPIEFTGAVGSIVATASADRRDVDAGDSIKLSVTWSGDGNLEFFDPPDPARTPQFKDFRIYGTTDRKAVDRRTVVYDLAPISPSAQAIPPIVLPVFDPVTKSYTSVATEAIPIRVRALAKTSALNATPSTPDTVLDIQDIQTESAREGAPGRVPLGLLLAGAALVPIGWLSTRIVVRKRGDPDSPRARARRAARKKLAKNLDGAQNATDQARALHEFLADRSGESREAWVGRDVRAWARAQGTLSDDDAAALATLVAELDEKIWAKGGEKVDDARILAAADRVRGGGL
ncbi:MAG: BatD family protein [Planctomycetota bacterium]